MKTQATWKTDKPKPWHRRWWAWALLLAVAAAVFAWPKARDIHRRWNAGRLVKQAAESAAQGDFRRALLDARNALAVNPADPEATEIMARSLEGSGAFAAAAQWRSRLDSIRPGSLQNIVAWASDSLKGGDSAAAARILRMLQSEPTGDATYHSTAAAVATAGRDTAAAERHWGEAVRLAPGEDRHRFSLAVLRLGSKEQARHAEVVATLKEIGARPAMAAEVFRVLLADAVHFTDWPNALVHADSLVADPRSTFVDKLLRLDALRAMNHHEASAYFADLRTASLDSPKSLYLMLMWMNQHRLAMMASEWARSLPADTIGAPPVCFAVAEAHASSSDWQRLQDFLGERSWGEWDCLRRVFAARALEHLGEADQAEQEWKNGISSARSRTDAIPCLERAVRLAISWGWEQRAQDVIWSMANSPGCPRWMTDALWLIALENSDTAQLQRLSAIRVNADPKSPELRNNHIFFSLLTRRDDGNPHREAERLFSENPGDASIAITRAFSLHLQGRTAEALATTSSLPPVELAKPNAAFYHAVFLTASGDGAKAAGFLAAAETRKLFPEEKSLLERAKLTAGRPAQASKQPR